MKMKKLLASALAAAMVVSSMVGAMVTSAATLTGTIAAGSVEVAAGATEVTVPVTIDFEGDVVSPHGMFTVSIADAELTSAVLENAESYKVGETQNGNIYSLWIDADGVNNGTILVESLVDANAPTISENIVVDCTFSVPAGVNAELDVVVSDVSATNYGEDDWNLTATDGKITVKVVHECTAGTPVPNGDGTHNIPCADPECDKFVEVNTPCNYVEGICSVCGFADPNYVAPCDHANATSEVTAQPTKDAVGTMTYTCECGHTWTEKIDVPEKSTSVFTQLDLYVAETVGNRIYVNYSANGGLTTKGYTDYILVIDYQKYGTGYATLEPMDVTHTQATKDPVDSSSKAHCFKFNEIALYEMPLEYTITLYLVDANGIVTAYTEQTTSIASQTLAYAKSKYDSGTAKDLAILKSVVDMVNFGAAAQEFFASSNSGSLIDGAILPNEGFDAYQDYASKESELPSEFNTTMNPEKVLSTSTLAMESTVITASSNFIRYNILATGYDASGLKGTVSYTNAYGTPVEDTIDFESLTPTVTGTGKVIYTYDFLALALYDLNATVTVTLEYNGVTEYTYDYSAENFISGKINDASFKDVFTKMVLFSQSTRTALVG